MRNALWLCGLMVLCGSAQGAEVRWLGPEGKSKVRVETHALTATIDPRQGGRITSLKLHGNPHEFVGPDGLCADMCASAPPPGLAYEPYQATFKKHPDCVEVLLRIYTEHRAIFRKLPLVKRYVFPNALPAVRVTVAVQNRSRFGRCFGLKAVHHFRILRRNEGFMWEGGKVQAIKEDADLRAVRTGWIGRRDGGSGAAALLGWDEGQLAGWLVEGEEREWLASDVTAIFKTRAVPGPGSASFQYDLVLLPESKDAADASKRAEEIRKRLPSLPLDVEKALAGMELPKVSESPKKTLPWFYLVGSYGAMRPSYRNYRIARALEHVPGGAWVFYSNWYQPGVRPDLQRCHWFPAPLEELQRYDAVIMVNVPFSVLGEEHKRLLHTYLTQGGTLIRVDKPPRPRKPFFLFGGRRNPPWIVPEAKSHAPIRWLDKGHPVTRGLPQTNLPTTYYRSRLTRLDERVLVAAGDEPILFVRPVGKGRLVTWTATPGPRLNDPAALENDLTRWDFHDELWQQLAMWCIRGEKPAPVGFKRFVAPARTQTAGPKRAASIEFEVENNSSEPVRVIVSVVSKAEARELSFAPAEQPLAPGKTLTRTLRIPLPKRDRIAYLVDVRNGAGVLLARRGGHVEARPETYLTAELGPMRCVGRRRPMGVDVDVRGPKSTGTRVTGEIVDVRGDTVQRLPWLRWGIDRPAGPNGMGRLAWRVGNLASGDYRIRLRLMDFRGRQLDSIERTFYVVDDLRNEEIFPSLMIGGLYGEPSLAAKRARRCLGVGLNGIVGGCSALPGFDRAAETMARSGGTYIVGPEDEDVVSAMSFPPSGLGYPGFPPDVWRWGGIDVLAFYFIGGRKDDQPSLLRLGRSASVAVFRKGDAQAFHLDCLRSARGPKRQTWLEGSPFRLRRGRCYPGWMGTQVYTALTHGARGLLWWRDGEDKWGLWEDEERIDTFRRAHEELRRVGPLFLHVQPARAPVALLGVLGASRVPIDTHYARLRQAVGQIDMLHVSHCSSGERLKGYKAIVLVEGAWLPTRLFGPLRQWVRGGGVLVVVGRDMGLLWVLDGRGQQGRVVRIKRDAPSTAMLRKALTEHVKPLCRAEHRQVDAMLHEDPKGKGRYLAAVNQTDEPVTTHVVVAAAHRPGTVRDLLTGKEVEWAFQDGRLKMKLAFEPGWGRAVAILPGVPRRLTLKAETQRVGGMLKMDVALHGDKGVLPVSLPVEVTVTDAEGLLRRHYGGVRTLVAGRWAHQVLLADNDPVGEWTVSAASPLVEGTPTVKLTVKPMDKE